MTNYCIKISIHLCSKTAKSQCKLCLHRHIAKVNGTATLLRHMAVNRQQPQPMSFDLQIKKAISIPGCAPVNRRLVVSANPSYSKDVQGNRFSGTAPPENMQFPLMDWDPRVWSHTRCLRGQFALHCPTRSKGCALGGYSVVGSMRRRQILAIAEEPIGLVDRDFEVYMKVLDDVFEVKKVFKKCLSKT